jgi:hypothetical protein
LPWVLSESSFFPRFQGSPRAAVSYMGCCLRHSILLRTSTPEQIG